MTAFHLYKQSPLPVRFQIFDAVLYAVDPVHLSAFFVKFTMSDYICIRVGEHDGQAATPGHTAKSELSTHQGRTRQGFGKSEKLLAV